MPNHVRQRLSVIGTQNDIAAFVATARGARPATGDREGFNANREKALEIEPLNFHMIAPLSDDFSRLPYGDSGSYGWEAEASGWSVKWGPYNIDPSAPSVSADGLIATYEFTCAWGPPSKALERASLRYPTLTFALSWGGEGPCRGRALFRDGKTVIVIGETYEQFKSEFPTDDEYEQNEDMAAEKADLAEMKHIISHGEWVSLLRTS